MSAGLRVAMLVSAPMPPREGIGTFAHGLSLELIEAGHRPTLITRGKACHARQYEVDGVPIVELPFAPLYPVHVHVHGVVVTRYLRRNAGEYDIIHAHSPLVPPVRGPWPVLTTLHSRLAESARSTRVDDARSLLIRLQTPISARLERALLQGSEAVVVLNPLLADGVAADIGRRVLVRIIPNAVNVKRFFPGPEVRASQDVLAVGRLVHGKGFEDLLGAWVAIVTMYPDARLTIVGAGPLRDRLFGLAASNGIAGSVRFTGALLAGELPKHYQQARVVVQPSHHEGLSTVILESMACSTPVVATAVGGHPSIIADGVNGRLVPAHQPSALAEAVSELLADREAAARIGRQGRVTVVESYSWASVARSYIALYEDLLAEPGPRRQ